MRAFPEGTIFPEHWKTDFLGKKIKLNYGKSQSAVQTPDGKFPIYGTGGLMGMASDWLSKGDSILLGRKGTLDNPLYISEPFWAVDTTFYVSDFEGSYKWLHYLFKFIDLSRWNEATGVPSLSRNNIEFIEIAFPPNKEQAKIAEVLATIDRAIAQTEALIAKHQRVKTGLMQDLLTRGIDEHGQLRNPSTHRFKSTPLGMIPEEWEYDLFGKRISSSAFGPRFPGTEYDDFGALATLRTTDMDNEGNIVSAKLPRANLNPADYEKHLLKPGDILISRSGTIGVTTVFTSYEVPVIPAAFIIRFRPKETLIPEYFRIYLNSYIGRKIIVTNAEGGVQKNLRGSTVLGLYFPFPKPDEQKQIAQIIEAQNNQISKLITQYEKLSSIKQGLMQDLLSGRVSVKVLMEG